MSATGVLNWTRIGMEEDEREAQDHPGEIEDLKRRRCSLAYVQMIHELQEIFRSNVVLF